MRVQSALKSVSIAALALGAACIWLRHAASELPATSALNAVPQRTPTSTSVPIAGDTIPVASVRTLPPPVVPPVLDESALMTELRRAQDSDPELALALARDGNQRFPDTEAAPERAAIIVHALTALGRPAEGRAEAEDMVNRYPDSTWVRQIEQYTGAHRHRNVRSTASGQLEYY